eukprot:scaffold15134_cov34-Tisochrysis_lutea.AAC.3
MKIGVLRSRVPLILGFLPWAALCGRACWRSSPSVAGVEDQRYRIPFTSRSARAAPPSEHGPLRDARARAGGERQVDVLQPDAHALRDPAPARPCHQPRPRRGAFRVPGRGRHTRPHLSAGEGLPAMALSASPPPIPAPLAFSLSVPSSPCPLSFLAEARALLR